MRLRLGIATMVAVISLTNSVPVFGQQAKVLLLVAPTKNHPAEYSVTREVLSKANCRVAVTCKGPSAKDLNGKEIPVDMTLEQVVPADFDAIAIIGGYSVWKYVGDRNVENILSGFVAADKCIGAICAGTYVLGKAGLLKGRKVTGPRSHKLMRYGARYVGDLVQQDGKVITAKGPSASEAFGKALAEIVKKPFANLY